MPPADPLLPGPALSPVASGGLSAGGARWSLPPPVRFDPPPGRFVPTWGGTSTTPLGVAAGAAVAAPAVCGVAEGSDPVALALAAAAEACARARSHVQAAQPHLWQGTAATRYVDRRAQDLDRIDRTAQAIEEARGALRLHVAARRELAAALATGGWM